MASELAWMSSTPKVDAPMALMRLLWAMSMFLNQRKEATATMTANILLESLTKKDEALEPKR